MTTCYRANFLFGASDGSVDEAGYEFANGKTEEYIKEWWDEVKSRIASEKDKRIAELERKLKLAEIRSEKRRKEADKLAAQHGTYDYKINSLRDERKGATQRANRAEAKLASMTERYETADRLYSTAKDQIHSLQTTVSVLRGSASDNGSASTSGEVDNG